MSCINKKNIEQKLVMFALSQPSMGLVLEEDVVHRYIDLGFEVVAQVIFADQKRGWTRAEP